MRAAAIVRYSYDYDGRPLGITVGDMGVDMRILNYHKNLPISCIAVLTLMSVGACGGHPNAADVPDTVTSAIVDLSSVDMEIMQAQDILKRQCMRTKGFDVPIDYTVITVPQSYVDVGGVFRSKEEAETVGYNTQTADLQGRNIALDAYVDTLSDSERNRYEQEMGDLDTDGCAAQAYIALFESPENTRAVFDTFDDVLREQSSSAIEDSDVQAAIKDEYMPCMEKAGYNVRGLRGGELASKKFGRYRKWNEPPNDEEKAMAVQDYECQASANLIQRINEALERNAGTWLVSNEAMLLERHEKLQQARERANQVISGQLSYKASD